MALRFLRDGYFVGTVGIGTASPDASVKLQVEETGSNAYIRIVETGNTGLDVGQETNGNGIINLRDNKDLRLFTNGTEAVRIKNTGNVGIGTDNPAKKLHVKESTTATYAAYIENSIAGGDYLAMIGDAGDNVFEFDSGGTGGEAQMKMYSDGVLKNLLDANGSSYFTGNVGIGTTVPSAKLEIVDTSNPGATSGSVIIEGRRDGSPNVLTLRARDASAPAVALPNSQGPVIRFQGFDGTDFENMGFIQVAADGQAVANADAPSFMAFGTSGDGSSSPTERMRIDSAGAIKFNTYGAGYLKTDSDGNITADTSAPGTGVFLPLAGGTMDSGATINMSGTLTIDGSSSVKMLVKGGARIALENANATDSFYLANTGGNAASILDLGSTLTIAENGGLSTFAGNVTTGSNAVQNGANPGLKVTSTNTSQTVLSINNTTSRNYELAVGGSASGIGVGSLYIYDGTAASARFVIDNTGNVGIGTTAPQKNLTIASAQGDGIQFNYDATSNYRHQILNYWNSNADSRMDFNIARTSGQAPETIMSVGYSGNVGIGTTSPSAKLDVAGDVLIDSGEYLSWGTVGATSIEGSTASNKLQFRTSSTDRMIINDTGVGIGTTSPSSKLEVVGNGGTILDIQGSQGQLFSVTDSLSGDIFAVADISGVPIFTVNSSSISYFDGKVGIGESSPDGLLHIHQTGSGTSNSIITEDDARKIFIGRDSIKATDLSNNAAMLYLQQHGGNATFGNDVIANGNIKINTGSHLFFDGGTNATYISEDVADRLRFFVGGAEFMRFTESTADTVNIFKNTTFGGKATSLATAASDGSTTLTTKSYVDGLVTGVPVYKGTWAAGTTGVTSAAINGTTITLTAAPTETIAIGDVVTADGIIAATTVTAVASQTSVTVSATVVIANTVTVTFSSEGGYPDLTLAAAKVLGNYYIVSTAGSAAPNGSGVEPDSWAVGDWCIFSDVTPGVGTDLWQRIDNSSVISGAGTGKTIPLWEGETNAVSETLTDSPITVSGNNSTFAGDVIGGGSITIGSGGGYNAGAIFSDANWGMIFRSLQASPNYADFMFANSADVERLRITSTGATFAGNITLTSGVLSISGDGSNAATLTESSAGILTIAAVDDIILDAEGDIALDANGGDIRLKDGGTTFGTFTKSGNNFHITSNREDGYMKFFGNDGGTSVTALTLNMADGGNATFAGRITCVGLSSTIDSATSGYFATNTAIPGGQIVHVRDNVATTLVSSAGGIKISSSPGNDAFLLKRWDHSASASYFAVQNSSGSEFITTNLATGYVGIGTTSPDAKLEVAGGSTGIRLSNLGDSGAYDSIEMTYNGYNSGTPEMKFRPTQTPGSGIVNSYFRFINSNGSSTAANNHANVTVDGKVGIGTDSPSSKLQVDGGIQMGNDSDTAAAAKVGTMRYRTGTEYVEVDGVELVTNGDFASSSNWSVTGGWTISGGKANYATAVTSYLVQTSIPLTSGVVYRVRFNVSGSSGSGAFIWIGNQAGNTNYLGGTYKYYADGDFEEIFTMPSNQTTITFYSQTASSNFSFDNVTLMEVTAEDASYADMCMQTGASTYEWVNIVRNTY